MPRRALLLCVLVGCTRAGPSARPGAVDLPGATAEDPAEESAPAAKITCAVDQPKGSPSEWRSLLHAAEVSGRSYYLALGKKDDDVLLFLGPSGGLVAVPVPLRTDDVARESATRLRFFADAEPPRWFTADLANPDAPVISSAVPALGLKHPGTLKAFASDGARALAGRYQVDYSTKPTRYFGETALYSVPDGKRTSPAFPVTAWSAACQKGRCVAAASREGLGVPVELYGMTDSGSELLGALDDECMGFTDWQDGERWLGAHPRKAGFELYAIELPSFRLTRKLVLHGSDCPSLMHVELAGRHGVVVRSKDGAPALVPVKGDLQVGDPEALPTPLYPESTLTPTTDGALWTEQRIGHGMMHSPTDSRGIRRYFRVWSFDGRAALLSRAKRGWRAESFQVLPRSGDEGEHSDGYRARPLVRPGFAAVMVDGGRVDATELLVLGRPCSR